MMNHNRRYYAGLLESWGLGKATDLYAWWFVDPHDLAAKWKARAERLTKSGRVVIRPFRRNDFAAKVARCQEVYNSAMVDLWGFVKLSDAEFQYFAKRWPRSRCRSRSCWRKSTAASSAFRSRCPT